MNWDTLRPMMNRYCKKVAYKGIKGRRLNNKTYAFLYNENQESLDVDTGMRKDNERIEVELFTNHILTLYPDNGFIVNNHNYWNSTCTKDRFRQLIPYRGSVSSWGLDRYGNDIRERVHVWTFHQSGYPSRPWKNNVVYDYCGRFRGAPEALLTIDAGELLVNVRDFATKTTDALLRGELDQASACSMCIIIGRLMSTLVNKMDLLDAKQKAEIIHHLLEHVQDGKPNGALVGLAMEHGSATDTVSAAGALLLRENWIIWQKAKSIKKHAEKMLRLFNEPSLSNGPSAPRRYKKNIRWTLTEYLLVWFGFQIGRS